MLVSSHEMRTSGGEMVAGFDSPQAICSQVRQNRKALPKNRRRNVSSRMAHGHYIYRRFQYEKSLAHQSNLALCYSEPTKEADWTSYIPHNAWKNFGACSATAK
jgi:hypothetical protein